MTDKESKLSEYIPQKENTEDRKFLEFEESIQEVSEKISALKNADIDSPELNTQILALQKERDQLTKKIYSKLSIWQTVQVARHPQRPHTLDYINKIFDLFRHNRSFNIISTLEKLEQFDLINQIRIGSGIFLYIPIGLLIFSIINYRTKTKYIEIIFVSIVSIIIATLLLNSQFIYNLLGVRLFRFHLNFIPIIIMVFIYLNLFIDLENDKKNYYFGKNNFNRTLLLFPALIFDFFLINSKSLFPYFFILFLYFPFLIILLKNNKKFKKVTFFIILTFVIIQPFVNIAFYKYQYKSVIKHDLEQYKIFINCFKTKSDYDGFDRVLATGTGEKERNYMHIR